ncbi:MAG: transrane type-1 protein [Dehalococcoidia bacterium]|nr:transrane type-1 protein [Dehalococcoidia bacterium]
MSTEPEVRESAEARVIPRAARGDNHWVMAWHRLRRKKLAMASLVFILVFYLSGIFAPLLAPYDYAAQDLNASFQDPSMAHPLGTDRLGRDVLSRLIWGARTSVIVSVMSVITGSIVFGVVMGLLAGYFGRWVDTAIMRVGEIFLAFPDILLVILIAATLRPRVVEIVGNIERATGIKGLVDSGAADYFVVFGALSVFSWVGMARLIRGQILTLRTLDFVNAAISLGASHKRIMFVHLLPNALNLILVSVTMGLGAAIGSELVLSWLGIGIRPPTPSLGVMIYENQGIQQFLAHPHVLIAPISVVSLVFFAFNLFGEGLVDALNPRAR